MTNDDWEEFEEESYIMPTALVVDTDLDHDDPNFDSFGARVYDAVTDAGGDLKVRLYINRLFCGDRGKYHILSDMLTSIPSGACLVINGPIRHLAMDALVDACKKGDVQIEVTDAASWHQPLEYTDLDTRASMQQIVEQKKMLDDKNEATILKLLHWGVKPQYVDVLRETFGIIMDHKQIEAVIEKYRHKDA